MALEAQIKALDEERLQWDQSATEKTAEAAALRAKPVDYPKRPEARTPVVPYCAPPGPVIVPDEPYHLDTGASVRVGSVLDVDFVSDVKGQYRFAGNFVNMTGTLMCKDMLSSGMKIGKTKTGDVPMSVLVQSFASLEDLAAKSIKDFTSGFVVFTEEGVQLRRFSTSGEKVEGPFLLWSQEWRELFQGSR